MNITAKCVACACIAFFFMLSLSPAIGQEQPGKETEKFNDGRYVAENAMVTIAVIIKDGEIADIEILEHRGGGEAYASMIKPMAGKIIETQSTEVDAVTGATVSSEALKNAVKEALKQASK